MIAPLAKIMSSSLVINIKDLEQNAHKMFVKLRGLLIHLCCSKVYSLIFHVIDFHARWAVGDCDNSGEYGQHPSCTKEKWYIRE